MARADRRRSQRQARHAQVTRPSGPSSASVVETTLFFPRLRRQAKWVFVLLAAVFGFGFVIFGVGSGSTGISEVFNGQIPFVGGGTTAGGPDAGDARERIEENPKDAQAHRDLATALRNDGKLEEAIAPLERYTQLRPKDANALTELAGLYLSKANRLQGETAAAQAESRSLFQGTLFLPSPESRLGREVRADPLTELVAVESSERLNKLYQETQISYGAAQTIYERIAADRPNDPQLQLQVANTAQLAGDTEAAVRAYKQFLRIAPDDPLAVSIRAQLKRLQQAQSIETTTPGG